MDVRLRQGKPMNGRRHLFALPSAASCCRRAARYHVLKDLCSARMYVSLERHTEKNVAKLLLELTEIIPWNLCVVDCYSVKIPQLSVD
eukprot:SAG31_NODE_7843_length_1584_cov_1.211448_2_plen_88_part_00